MQEQSNTTSRRLPSKNELERALSTFSPLERLAFLALLAIAAIAVIAIIYRINDHFLVSVPETGGTWNEGVIGTPRYVNPLLSTSDADKDLSALVYRGLMKKDADGTLVPDLASGVSVSEDGLVYTFSLKKEYFQDGSLLTSEDVLFTVTSAQNATLRSPERIKWQGVSAKVIDPSTISFTLKSAYAPFLESTTLGILPKAVWEKIPYESWIYSDHNTKGAIGAGPFQVKSVSQTNSGIPDSYALAAFRKNADDAPRIDSIVMHFYASETDLLSAYQNGDIDAAGGISAENAATLSKGSAHILSTPLPRVFGLFFNQGQQKIFTDLKVRQAIRTAINKEGVVAQVLKGYGTAIVGPVPGIGEHDSSSGDVEKAKSILEKDGWKLGSDGIYAKQISKKETQRLSFEIATTDTPELKEATTLIASNLAEAGIEAIPKVYESGSLAQTIIRPRKFQALFFGEVVASQSDLFAFWDSSQRTDPGLNISGYANTKVDKALESALSTLDPEKRAKFYAAFESEIEADVPAVFVYSPSYIYVVAPSKEGITLPRITSPEDRFNVIKDWYLDTDRVWKIFAPKKVSSD